MILVDTSVWIDVLRDRSDFVVKKFRERTEHKIIVFTRFTQLELLQGAKDHYEWQRLDEYLSTQYYLEALENTWRNAARIYYDLRKKGSTTNSPVDCCIAQIAIEENVLLLHKDKDFERISRIRPLKHEYFHPRGDP